MATVTVPYVDLAGQHAPLKAELMAAVEAVIDSGKFVLGPQVEEFERAFAGLCGTKYALGLNSGTDALVLALQALGVGPGDEVITAPNSFVASTTCIKLVGATPVFADVGPDYLIDPAKVEAAVTPRTKAIIPVHLTGRACDMDAIVGIARKHNLHVVEDCAQAVLAEYRGRRVGSFGAVGCFSLHPLKTLNACGDGGVVTTNDPALYDRMKVGRNIGLRTREDCAFWSGNTRLDTLQASILLVKLEYLERWTRKRQENARFYQEALTGVPGVTTPIDRGHLRSVYHTFVIQADRRDELRQYLAAKGVETVIHYPTPIHLMTAAKDLGYPPGSFPVTEAQARKIVSLPVFPELTRQQLATVAGAIREFYLAGSLRAAA